MPTRPFRCCETAVHRVPVCPPLNLIVIARLTSLSSTASRAALTGRGRSRRCADARPSVACLGRLLGLSSARNVVQTSGAARPSIPPAGAGSADAAWAVYELAQSSPRHRTPAFSKTHPLVSVLGVRGEVHLMLGHQRHLPLEHPYERHARMGRTHPSNPSAMLGVGSPAGSRDSRAWVLAAM